MAPVVFPDNTVFCNFAAVERVDLLITRLRGRGRWRVRVDDNRSHHPDTGVADPAQSSGKHRERAGRTPLMGFYELVGVATYDEVRESDTDCQVTWRRRFG